MYAVGRIGSYITRGVYTVSGPFHPFGGAVDIVVVEQPDGSFKSSPWYVRFGKFQGVLKTREKVVSICVNGVESNIHMYLDERGEAYFLGEMEDEDGVSVLCHLLSGDETDGQSSGDETGGKCKKNLGPRKSESCNGSGNKVAVGERTDAKSGKIFSRADSSRRSRSMGFLFRRKSIKQDSSLEGCAVTGMPRTSSLDRAEIALPTRYDGDDHMPTNDEESLTQSPTHDPIETIYDNRVVAEESDSCGVEKDSSSDCSFVSLVYTVDGTDVEMLNLRTAELQVETSGIDKIILEGNFEGPSELSTTIDEPCIQNDDLDSKTDSVIAELPNPDSEIPIVLGAQTYKRVYQEQKSGESLPGTFDSDEASQSENIQCFVCSETSDISAEQTHEAMYVASGESMQVQFCSRTLQTIAKPLSEGKDDESKNIMGDRDHIEICSSSSQPTNSSCCMHGLDETKLEGPAITSESCTCIISVDPSLTSAVDVDSKSSCSNPNFKHKGHQIQEENNIIDRVIRNELQSSLDIGGHPEQIHGGRGSIEATCISVSESSEEEQFLFCDLDDLKPSELQCESKYGVDKYRHPSAYLEDSKEVDEPFETRDEYYLFPEQMVEENQNPALDNLRESSSILSSPIGIPKVRRIDTETAQTVKSLPMWSRSENLDSDEVRLPRRHSLDLKSKSMEWTFHINDSSHSMNLDSAIKSQPAHNHSNSEDMYKSEDLENFVSNPANGDPREATAASGGSWKLWPFSFRRSRSENSVEPAPVDIISSEAENASDNNIDMDRSKNGLKPEITENKIRSKIPTSEQLASLNLMEGKNVVTFTFSTAVLGKQQVDARIFLWKWNTRVVISDVDGTITRSDVLGQFMPLVGVDWSQTGVAHLFSAIKENGYQLLFLSARSISQAYITRQFLVNLKQDGKALPDGPVVISPDGLFPSLYREVIRRAPHEFKIACLEDIKVLFPPDCSPFYAGFGNRDTDEISYLKVGIPKGKIFIINPKGEVAVHRRVDTKSYTSLHALVHDMFPPSQSFEQEDFNSWNYWKLAPPLIDS